MATAAKKYKILAFTAETESSVNGKVKESIRTVTGVADFKRKISDKYVVKAAWFAAADAIEKRLRTHHGYVKFLLSDKEAAAFYKKTFEEFAAYCTKKIIKGKLS